MSVPVDKDVDKSSMWLVVEWKGPAKRVPNGYSLISVEEIVDKNWNAADFHTGKVVSVKVKHEVKKACIVIVSNDKQFLEMELKHLQETAQTIKSQKPNNSKKRAAKQRTKQCEKSNPDLSEEDFTVSPSDWAPSEEADSEAENRAPKQKKKRRTHTCSKRFRNGPKKKNGNTKAEQTHEQSSSNSSSVASTSQLYSRPRSEPLIPCPPPPRSYLAESRHYQAMDHSPPPPLPLTPLPPQPVYSHPRQRLSYMLPNTVEFQQRVPPMTFDQQTQTCYSSPDSHILANLHENQKHMGEDISFLHKLFEEMGNKIQTLQDQVQHLTYNRSEPEYESPPHQPSVSGVLKTSNAANINNGNPDPYRFTSNSPPPKKPQPVQPQPPIHPINPMPSNIQANIVEVDGTDMVGIGSGMTLVPKHTFYQIQWESYTSATRKLLMAVFPRKTLATHSMTGKKSPAFSKKPPKMKLDARKVADIIMTVSQMCNTPENLIRTIITTKCADENKMFRQRQEKNKNKQKNENDDSAENGSNEEIEEYEEMEVENEENTCP